jgi:hypothetical protein
MPNKEVYILTNFDSPRLQYVLNELFCRRLGLTPILIFHLSQYINEAPLIVYGDFECHFKHLRLKNWDFLHRHTIEGLDNKITLSSNYENVDPLTASFLLLSRYEEYLPHKKNDLNSYPFQNSLAFKNQMLQLPLVDIWTSQIAIALEKLFYGIEITYLKAKKTLTVDVDIAYAYKGRSTTRTILAIGQQLVKLNFKGLTQRFNVWKKLEVDPYDNYETLFKDGKSYDEVLFFFPAGKNDKFNRHIPIENPIMKKLLKTIPAYIEIGLHPIKQKNKNLKGLIYEKETLTNISQKTINKSRQHYLDFDLPNTFNQLLEAEIKEDYSIGYNEINGFRAGTCQSFNFFNLITNEVTELLCNPLIVMDATYIYSQKISIENAIEETIRLYEICKKYNGNFIIDFHNNHIQNSHPWHPYYLQIQQYLKKN